MPSKYQETVLVREDEGARQDATAGKSPLVLGPGPRLGEGKGRAIPLVTFWGLHYNDGLLLSKSRQRTREHTN